MAEGFFNKGLNLAIITSVAYTLFGLSADLITNDRCSAQYLACHQLVSQDGSSMLELTSTGPFNVPSALARLKISGNINEGLTSNYLSNLSSGTETMPVTVTFALNNGIIGLPSELPGQVEFINQYDLERSLNEASQGGFVNSAVEFAIKWAGIPAIALLAAIKSKINSRRRYTPHPHAGVPKLSPKDFSIGNNLHSAEEWEKLSDEEKAVIDAKQSVLTVLTEYEVLPRTPFYQSWPMNPKHKLDHEAVDALAEIYQEVRDKDVFISLVRALKTDQLKKGDEVYSEAYNWQQKNGISGPGYVHPYKDHKHLLGGRKFIESFTRRFFGLE